MSPQASFGAILDTPASDVEKPKPLPQGFYFTTLVGLPKFDKSSKKQTEYVEFTHKIIQAGEDVDQEELQAMGGIENKTLKSTFYLTENSVWRLKEFLIACGIEEGTNSLRQMIESTPNCQVGVHVKHEPSGDGTSVFAKPGSYAAVE